MYHSMDAVENYIQDYNRVKMAVDNSYFQEIFKYFNKKIVVL
ncbi:MAG TPA: hypothetical protein ENI78_01585 [Euryarchaeota archaeon]|nr:hypothetical protein [Euryarchaeota archaeon]